MPLIAILHLLIAIGFIVHAERTGRPQFWRFVLIFVPFVGSIAYILFELLPELAHTRRARQVATNLTDIIAPDREWQRRVEDAALTDSVDAKRALAEECERKGMWPEAIALYRSAAQGVFAEDPGILFSLARAELGANQADAALATLDRLRQSHPKLQHQNAHLLYARTLEALGRMADAEREYDSLSWSYVGLEARARYGLFLLRQGEPQKAQALFRAIVREAEKRRILLSDADRDWLKVAKANV